MRQQWKRIELPVTYSIANEFLTYNPESGVLRWKERDQAWFSNHRIWKGWNARCAGKVAGHISRVPSKARTEDDPHLYRYISILGTPYIAHRIAYLIMTGNFAPSFIFHVNGDTLDNRWDNLTLVRPSSNR